MSQQSHLIVKDIQKSFPGVKALDKVSLSANRCEALGLIGINGAGKSTLMNILAGEIKADFGQFFIDGKEVAISNKADSEKNSIALIHQEAVMFPSMTVAENIFVNNMKQFKKNGLIRYDDMNEKAKKYLDMLNCNLDPKALVRDVTVGNRQLIETARALSQEAEIILFDEPTSSLTIDEKDKLFEIISILKKQKKVIIYITHFIDEILKICERAAVMVDGRVIDIKETKNTCINEFITLMVGRSVQMMVNESEIVQKNPILIVKNLNRLNKIKDVSFSINEGEILGLWGLLGSGRTEIIRAILNLDRATSKIIQIKNSKGQFKPITGNKLLKLAGYVTEDRHASGLFMIMPIWKNITMPILSKFKKLFLKEKKEKTFSQELINKMGIKTQNENVRVDKLSGGNQQKVIMARIIGKKPRLAFLDEPTRGVDVHAKAAIHKLILDLKNEGCGIFFVSSEIEEIINLCDRVLVINKGSVVAEVKKDEINKQNLMTLCFSGKGM